jgi:hypothetical protein
MHPQDLRRAVGLGGARGGVAAGTGLALREIDDPHAVARPHGPGERATAGQLHIVAMSGNGEEVNGLGHEVLSTLVGIWERGTGKRALSFPTCLVS